MTIENLNYFLEIAKDMNITAAAERLMITRQSLSAGVRRLESKLGTPLLTRKPALELTEAGKLTLKTAQEIVDAHGVLTERLAGLKLDNQRICIRKSSSIYMQSFGLAIINRFSARCPGVEVSFVSSRDLRREHFAGDWDFALGHIPCPTPEHGSVHLFDDPIVIVVPKLILKRRLGGTADGFAARAVNGVEVDELRGFPLILPYHKGRVFCQEYIDRIAPEETVKCDNTPSDLVVVQCVGGKGCILVTRLQFRLWTKANPELSQSVYAFPLREGGVPALREINLVYKKSRLVSRPCAVFRDTVLEFFAEGSAGV